MLTAPTAAPASSQTPIAAHSISVSAPQHSQVPLDRSNGARNGTQAPRARAPVTAAAPAAFSEDDFDSDFGFGEPAASTPAKTSSTTTSSFDVSPLAKALPSAKNTPNAPSSAPKTAPPPMDDDGWGEDPEDDLPDVIPPSRHPVVAAAASTQSSQRSPAAASHQPTASPNTGASAAQKPQNRPDASALLSYARTAAPAAKKTTTVVSHSAFDDFDMEEPEPAPVQASQRNIDPRDVQSRGGRPSDRFAYRGGPEESQDDGRQRSGRGPAADERNSQQAAPAGPQKKRHNLFDDESDVHAHKPQKYTGPNLESYFHEREDDDWSMSSGGRYGGGYEQRRGTYEERRGGSRGGYGDSDRYGGGRGGFGEDDRFGGSRGSDRFGTSSGDRYGSSALDRSGERAPDRYGDRSDRYSSSDRYGGSGSDRYGGGMASDRYERPLSRGSSDDNGSSRGMSRSDSGFGDDWSSGPTGSSGRDRDDRYGGNGSQDRYAEQDRYGSSGGRGRYDEGPPRQSAQSADRYGGQQSSRGGYGDDWGSGGRSAGGSASQAQGSSRGSPAPSSTAPNMAGFKDAKAISSSQFFAKDERGASDVDRARLGRFSGATAISSDDFHGRPRQAPRGGAGGNNDLFARVTETAKSDLLSLTGSLLEGGKKFASGVSAWLDGEDDF